MITLTIPNDDTIALRQFGKALIEIASEKDGHSVNVTITPLVISADVEERLRAATEKLQQSATNMMDEPEVDTTAQQVESLAPRDGRSIEVTREMVELCVPVKPNIDPPTTDSTGTPWDERIHSASKALNADGTWRLRRKPKDMDELEWSDYVSMIKADLQYPVECGGEKELTHGEEIREAMDKAERGEAVYYTSEEAEQKMDEFKESVRQRAEPPVTPPGDDFHTDAGVVTEQTAAGIPPLSVPPPVVVAPPVTEWDFPRLMTFLTERHGKIDVATVNTLLAQDGMSLVQELNAHPDKIGPFVARVKAHLGE